MVKIKQFKEITNFDKLLIGGAFVLYFDTKKRITGNGACGCPYLKISKKMAFSFYDKVSTRFSKRNISRPVQKINIEVITL